MILRYTSEMKMYIVSAPLESLNELKKKRLDCFGAKLLAKTTGGRFPPSSSRAPNGGVAIQKLEFGVRNKKSQVNQPVCHPRVGEDPEKG
ncbi:MAG TPA: hypothetical protein VMW10_07385 [Alphaproteobacteria bacterium]|nr:hypothetical protein [Alphaproteobacteria bacterium]